MLPWLTLTFGIATVSVLTYSALVPWWKTRPGIAYFAMFWALYLVVLLFFYEALIAPVPTFFEVTLIMTVNVAYILNLVIFTDAQLMLFQRKRKEKKNDRE